MSKRSRIGGKGRKSEDNSARAAVSAAQNPPGAQDGTQRATRQLAKSADPAYMKFTTYIRKSTHLAVKTRLVSKEKELSDLVEELLTGWLKENDSFGA